MASRDDRATARAALRTMVNENATVDNDNQENIHPNPVQVTVSGAGLDTYIPTIPEVRESDINTKFKVKD